MKKFILLILYFFVFNSFSFGLDVTTHEIINEGISVNSVNGFDFNKFSNDHFGFQKGKDEVINGKEVYKWFKDGGRYEDKPPWTIPYRRSFNHFHNPLKALSSAGYGLGKSAVIWSQAAPKTQSPGGYYSWHDAREYYHAALTATSQEAREENFARMFRALGQVMHLVQDMSVPEHARGDGHVLPAYEEWVAKKPDGKALTVSALANPTPFDLSALRQPSPFAEAPVPIARLFDSRQYDGSNPEVTTTANIGLAEYTNANFASGDTLFTKKFPYPSRKSSVKEVDWAV